MVRAADKILRFDSASPTVANLLDRDGVLLLDPVDDDVEKARLRYLLPSGYTLKQAEGGALLVARVDHAGVRTIRVPHVRDDDGRDAPARWLIDPPADGEQAAVILEIDVAGLRPPFVVRGLPARHGPASGAAVDTLAPPSNDACGGAIGVPPAGPFPWTSAVRDVLDATLSGDPLPSCQSLVSRGVWYRFTPAETTDYTLSLCANGPTSTTAEDTILAVYTSSNGQCSGAMTELGGYCDDDSCSVEDFQSSLQRVRLDAGKTYFILSYLFDTEPPSPGRAQVQLRVEKFAPPPPPPANDTCAGAELVPGSGPFPYTTALVNNISGGTTDGDPQPSCRVGTSRGLWYRFTPSKTATYRIATCASEPCGTTVDDTVLGVFTSSDGTCNGAFTEVRDGCADDGCAAEPGQGVIDAILLEAGTSYDVLAYKGGPSAPEAADSALQLVFDENPPGPANDFCEGAELVPGAGPFPWLSTVTSVSDATRALDPPKPSCQSRAYRSVWYAFTPETSGPYRFSTCADAPTETSADDTVVAVYESTGGTCDGALVQLAGACDDDGCRSEANQAALESVELIAGTTYYAVVSLFGAAPPAAGQDLVQLRVERDEPAANDTCAGALPLPLDTVVTGRTRRAADDFQIAGASCFAPQSAVTPAAGRDVVFRFDAPAAGRYSFRVTGYPSTLDPVVYVARECPAAGGGAPVGQCLRAANRNASFGAEFVDCVTLAAAERVFVFVDEAAASDGSVFAIEASRCLPESEPNDTPATADANGCGLTGAIDGAGDRDFFALGAPAAGSRVFAVVDGLAASGQDFDLRMTSATDTLEYDDANNDPPLGSLSANAAGVTLSGAPAYLRVSYYDAGAGAAPYRVLTTVRPPDFNAALELEPNDTLATATVAGDGYLSGFLSSQADADHFSIDARAGDLLFLSLDLDPRRGDGPFDGALALLDAGGTLLVSANDVEGATSITSGAGALDATTPNAPGEAIVYRVPKSGRLFARVSWSAGVPGEYLLSIDVACPAADSDADGASDAEDCAPLDPSARKQPATVAGFSIAPDSETLTWESQSAEAGPGTVHDVVRGNVLEWPIGSGTGESCVASGIPSAQASDAVLPAPGAAIWYLVRARNACGDSGYGMASGGAARVTGACP